MTSLQTIMQRIQEAQQEAAGLEEELSSLDQQIRDDREDFYNQRMGIAQGRSERSVIDVVRAERARMKELQERREELPFEIHSARARALELEVVRFEQQESEAQERLKAAQEAYAPIKERLDKIKSEFDEAEGAVRREHFNIEGAQNAAVRQREELQSHMEAGPQLMPEFIPANPSSRIGERV